MLQKEFYMKRYDGVNLYRTYSDINHYIQKVGTSEVYTEAIDIEDAPYEYVETDIVIENETDIEIPEIV